MRSLVGVLVVICLFVPAPLQAAQQPHRSTSPRTDPVPSREGATITILHFNDVYEIAPVEAGKSGGLARVATLRAKLKAQDPSLITTLAGDFLSPSALGTAHLDGEALAGRQMVAVLNTLDLDWATLGNHEFDLPEATFRTRLAEAKFKIISSNVTDVSGAPFPGTVPHLVVPIKTAAGTIRVGLIGLTIDSNKKPWVRFTPPVEAARAAIAQLEGRCDVIIALTHLALETDRAIAEQLPEIGLILGGHEHENWLIERGPNFTPIVKADANVRTVAIVTLRIPVQGARPLVSTRFERIDDAIKEAPGTGAEVRKWTDLGYAGFRKEGFEPTEVVATIDTTLYGRESDIRHGSTDLTTLICEAMRHEAGTEIAIFNAGSIRIDDVLVPGPVTQYDVLRILPFGGKVVKATFTGSLLSLVLGVGEQNKGSGGFLHSVGVPAVIDPTAHYTLAISDFLMTGAEVNLAFLTRQHPDVSNVSDLRDVRIALIGELKKRFRPGAR